jgi:hypothetical protein
MFDDLRDKPEDSDFLDEEYESPYDVPTPRRRQRRFLGMTAAQRLVISVLLLGAVIVVGSLCLLVAGKVAWIP